MRERPILFSAPMVKALLAGTKTQTRRIVKQQDCIHGPTASGGLFWIPEGMQGDPEPNCPTVLASSRCPYGQPGDRLWVKETWKADQIWDGHRPLDIPEGEAVLYTADEHATRIVPFGWGRGRPSIFMRRWMSRITLELTSVRVERLNAISEEDAQAEGVVGCARQNSYPRGCEGLPQRAEYAILWESINGSGSWAANPWVWVLSFRRVAA